MAIGIQGSIPWAVLALKGRETMTEEFGMECPQCGNRTVRVDMPPEFPDTARLEEIILKAGRDEITVISFVCASCSFNLEREVTVKDSESDKST
ncbi:hypothetical protein SAMN05216218_10215 [Halorientalis regularis]|uniref:Uncharacterized protein n=1 Tax=Halorientalis regularis TaxID=660518 RepID=A0A1G7GF92_9EURY|nr:hypothetical protein SAMN05216218_10215 [Halorientalis regularis]